MEILGFAAGPYKTNCYVVRGENEVAIIDPGMHSHDDLVEYISTNKLGVDKIVLTHGHIDHTRDAGTLAKRFNAPVYIHPNDAFFLEAYKGSGTKTAMLFDADNMVSPAPESLHDLVDGETITLAGEEFTLAHAPGHSPGCTLIIGKEYCFSGDVLFKGSIGRTDFEWSDADLMNESLRTKVLPLDDSLQILPGHGPTTTMRAERTGNPFLLAL
ncbi:Zn-dependent hydrolase [Corynebacterium suranareeae]|uniref:Zn-dependent hydrolase n=1 Tax=Corynebacterium suranareeae TaxID=2506452 RepID=A0A169RXK8_9CORY|nr:MULTISPECIES: MBL fold metallo-hydrolase [Corynebacterium]BAU95998.1 Zn-dependent hydrolase [Corynebacterium suranareeae]GAV97354.1 Zn-dependent hydrolase [Corynebacterium glutamicum]